MLMDKTVGTSSRCGLVKYYSKLIGNENHLSALLMSIFKYDYICHVKDDAHKSQISPYLKNYVTQASQIQDQGIQN